MEQQASDDVLLTQWQTGDKRAGQALLDRYYTSVSRFFRNKLTGDVVDLIQDTFARVVASRDRVRDRERFRAYVFTVAYRVLNDHLRQRYRAPERIDLQQVSMADVAPGPSSVVGRSQEERLLLESLRRVPVDVQVLLELRYWEQLKTADIAQVLDIPHGTVRSRLHRAHDVLRDVMTRLAESPQQLHSTLDNLTSWAASCRARVSA